MDGRSFALANKTNWDEYSQWLALFDLQTENVFELAYFPYEGEPLRSSGSLSLEERDDDYEGALGLLVTSLALEVTEVRAADGQKKEKLSKRKHAELAGKEERPEMPFDVIKDALSKEARRTMWFAGTLPDVEEW